MTEKTKLSYLAGVFDGEGCICISKQIDGRIRYKMNIILSNCDLRLMKWLVQNFGGQYYVQCRAGKFGHVRTEYRWSPKGKKNREQFLLDVLPYLIMKREQALLAIQFERILEDNPQLRESLRFKISNLNKGSLTTNMQELSESDNMIEPELTGDRKSAPLVTVDA